MILKLFLQVYFFVPRRQLNVNKRMKFHTMFVDYLPTENILKY